MGALAVEMVNWPYRRLEGKTNELDQIERREDVVNALESYHRLFGQGQSAFHGCEWRERA